MKRAPRTAHLRIVPPTPSTLTVAESLDAVYPDRTRAEVARLYPKSDPAEVASLQDTEMARRFGICAAWVEGGVFKFALGRLVG